MRRKAAHNIINNIIVLEENPKELMLSVIYG
jgi:hypothetical protein